MPHQNTTAVETTAAGSARVDQLAAGRVFGHGSQRRVIRNPILSGFNPDPSTCRVSGDDYIATSTFEWLPGVQIHHSRDPVDRQLVARPLNHASQLDLRRNLVSGATRAPCLSYADGLFRRGRPRRAWFIHRRLHRHAGF